MILHSRLTRVLAILCAIWTFMPVGARAAEVAPQVMVTLPADAKATPELATRIAKWRADGLITDAMRLDANSGQEEPGFSTLLILRMKSADALERWKKAAAHDLPANSRVRRVDTVVKSGNIESATDALFEVNVYGIKTTDERYRQFSNEYIVPLMAGQVDADLMTAYTMYVEEGAAGDRNSVLVKAYRAKTFERVADFKLDLRKRLATHPTYPKWHPIKDTLRDDTSETLASMVRGP